MGPCGAALSRAVPPGRALSGREATGSVVGVWAGPLAAPNTGHARVGPWAATHRGAGGWLHRRSRDRARRGRPVLAAGDGTGCAGPDRRCDGALAAGSSASVIGGRRSALGLVRG